MSENTDGDHSPTSSGSCDAVAGAFVGQATEKLVFFTAIHNRNRIKMSIPSTNTVLDIKRHLEPLISVPCEMQKLIFQGILHDSTIVQNIGLPEKEAKIMVVGTDRVTADQVRKDEQTDGPLKPEEMVDNNRLPGTDTWSEQTDHKRVLEQFGKPEDAMIGIINSQDNLAPDEPLSGMLDKRGQHLRLRVKGDNSELWLTTPSVTHKIPLATVFEVESQSIPSHPEYHIMAFQLGPTHKSRFFVYWMPAQYVESIKTMVLQYRILHGRVTP